MRVKGIVSYDGSNYHGFQKQINEKTIQGEIEGVLSKILNRPVNIFGSGRTDAKVHALNQVFHFDLIEERDLNKLHHSLNKLLPEDIYIKSLEVVNDGFHARFSVLKKHYTYKVSLQRNPFLINYSLLWLKSIDEKKLIDSMNLFLGEHNFWYFCANKEEDEYVKTIYEFRYRFEDNQLIFDIVGNGFKRYMVRMIIGTILAYMDNQINLDYIVDRLNVKAGLQTTSYNAEPQGLYLTEVIYD